jgi:hypothetical protein
MRVQKKIFLLDFCTKAMANIEELQVHFHLLVMEQWGNVGLGLSFIR